MGKNFGVEVWTPLGNQSPPKHVVWRKKGGDTVKNVLSRGAQEVRKKYLKKVKNIWTWYFTPMPGRLCGADCHSFWHVGSYRRRNHPRQISSQSVKGFGVYGYPKSGVSHWLWSSPLQQCYALPCYTLINCTLANSDLCFMWNSGHCWRDVDGFGRLTGLL